MTNFQLEFEVRDNELDIQGVVNNANYLIYLAHARHIYLKQIGISFAKWSEEKQYLLLTSTNIEFKQPLKAEDKFFVTCKMLPEGRLRFAFEQNIIRADEKHSLIAKSYNVGVCINGNNRNRPYVPEILKQHFSV